MATQSKQKTITLEKELKDDLNDQTKRRDEGYNLKLELVEDAQTGKLIAISGISDLNAYQEKEYALYIKVSESTGSKPKEGSIGITMRNYDDQNQ